MMCARCNKKITSNELFCKNCNKLHNIAEISSTNMPDNIPINKLVNLAIIINKNIFNNDKNLKKRIIRLKSQGNFTFIDFIEHNLKIICCCVKFNKPKNVIIYGIIMRHILANDMYKYIIYLLPNDIVMHTDKIIINKYYYDNVLNQINI